MAAPNPFPGPPARPLRYPWLWRGLALLLLAAVVWLSLTPSPPTPPAALSWDKAQHALAYVILAWSFGQVWPRSPARVAAGLIVIGVLIELAQAATSARVMEGGDVLANTVGVLGGTVLCHTPLGGVFHWVERLLVPGHPRGGP
ncbi:MAG: VanZ family protein [Arhodomonas sp.]|nr:VanZ family protein [Arhodomonas sp.]